MEAFRNLRGIGSTELRRLNQCQLYLQVTLLSEITSANGLSLLPNFVQGNKHPGRRSTLTWPRQDRPTHTAWREWKSRLAQIYCKSRRGLTLRHALKQWHTSSPQYQEWDDHYDHATDTIYRRDPTMDIIIRHDRIPNTQAFYQYGSMVSARPVSATPAQIRQCPTMLQIAAHRHRNIPPNQRSQPSTLQSRLLQLDPSEQQLVGTHLQMPHHEASFKQDLLNGKVHSGSDGSVKSLQASHSWVLQSSRTGDFMASHARTYPLNQQLSSKRPEAAGHAAALIVTRELLQGHSTPINATMRFHIDNKAVVKGSQPTHKRGARSTLIPEWDLMDKIHVLKQSLPIQTATIWVKGHQDTPDGQRRIPIKKLSFAAQLNCHADALATSHHHCHTCNQKTVFHPPPHSTGIHPGRWEGYHLPPGKNNFINMPPSGS